MTLTDTVIGFGLFYAIWWPQQAGQHLNIVLTAAVILP